MTAPGRAAGPGAVCGAGDRNCRVHAPHGSSRYEPQRTACPPVNACAAYAEGLGDNPAPQLTPSQNGLVSALEKTGKPVIVVVIAGRPPGLGPAEQANATLMAYQGSTEAGRAAADVIFGKVDPSGKLPVTWPSDAAAPGGDFDTTAPSPLGDQPKFFDQLSCRSARHPA
jgi:beta-glucosidase